MKEKKMPIALHASMILASRKGRIEIFRAMQAIFKTVNENGGWSLIAWSKQGKIKDEAQKKDCSNIWTIPSKVPRGTPKGSTWNPQDTLNGILAL